MLKRPENIDAREKLFFESQDLFDGKNLVIGVVQDRYFQPWVELLHDDYQDEWYAYDDVIQLPGGKKKKAFDLVVEQFVPEPPFNRVMPLVIWYAHNSGRGENVWWMKRYYEDEEA